MMTNMRTSILSFLCVLVISSPVLCMAKTASVMVTAEMRASAMRNVERHAWAQADRDRLMRQVEPWMRLSDEQLWKMLPSQDMPRDSAVNRGDGCPNCGKEHYNAPYNPSRWHIDLFDRPWRIQCRNCKIWLPGNNFAAYYESALDDQHRFRLGDGDASLLEPDDNPFVDDGTGIEADGHKFFAAAHYAFVVWREAIDAAENLATLYTLTENPQYAHKAAVILDRAADLYPQMNFRPHYRLGMETSTGGTGNGRIQGMIWECFTAEKLSRAYDYIYDAMMEDESLVAFASDMAQRYDRGDKSSSSAIASHIERNLLSEFIKSVRDRQIWGNAGMTQSAMAVTAIALDNDEQTPAALEWLFEPNNPKPAPPLWDQPPVGGEVPLIMVEQLGREGLSDEAGSGYASIPARQFVGVADLLRQYPRYDKRDIYRDYPKFRNAFTLSSAIRVANTYIPNWGDSNKCGNSVGSSGSILTADQLVSGFLAYDSEAIAREIYEEVGGKLDRIHGSIYDENPDAVADRIREYLSEPPGPLRSFNSGGYGLAVLHAPQREHPRGVGLYYGRMAGHGHEDRLAISLVAHDIAMCPDMGYPLYTGSNPRRIGWTSHTVSHNTLMVNDTPHESGSWSGKTQLFAQQGPLHIADIDGDPAVSEATQTYRRAMMQVDVSESESYFLDLFMVRGGEIHRLIQNGNGPEVVVEGVAMTPQDGGTMAGKDVEYASAYDGPVGSWSYKGSGLQFLKRVERGGSADYFTVDWNLVETWRKMPEDFEAHLRVHNLSPVDEVAIADGFPPEFNGAPKHVRYLHRVRRGANLNSLFVSVLDPYGNSPNVASARVLKHVTQGDIYAAVVEVRLADGRRDVIMYRSEPGVLRVDDHDLNGRVGFTRFDGDAVTQRVTIGDTIVGKLAGFDDTDPTNIQLRLGKPLPADVDVVGRYIIIDNAERSDASYLIERVIDERTLGIGTQALVERFIDPLDYSKGVIYNVKSGDRYRIALPEGAGAVSPGLPGQIE
jgi:hypothetical protein